MRLHSVVKIGNSYGKIINKKPIKYRGIYVMKYQVYFKNRKRQWYFKSEMTHIW